MIISQKRGFFFNLKKKKKKPKPMNDYHVKKNCLIKNTVFYKY